MADDQDDSQKTEEPSQKKLDDARKKGQVTSSQEVKHWFVLLGAALVIGVFGPLAAFRMTGELAGYLTNLHAIPMESEALLGMVTGAAMDITLILAAPLGVLVIAAIAGSVIQTGVMASAENIKPKLEKINPLAGLKRQFALKALAEFVKGLIKIAVVGVVATMVIVPEFRGMEQLSGLDAATVMERIYDLSVQLMIAVLAIVTLIAALDYLYQRFEFMKQQRMTKQEVKDEYKQSEGDPMVKARLRQIRMERSRRRMIQAVPEADVVITNPTHFAIAMKYEPGEMGAPRVLAKGVDAVAFRIREVAEEHGVAVVENPPLARALYAAVDVDEEIPPEHYKAVAEIISYVFKLRSRRLPAPSS